MASNHFASGPYPGKYDVTDGAYVSFMVADALQHANLRVLAPASTMAPLTQEVMVPAGPPIQHVSDLKGKKIGLNAKTGMQVFNAPSMLRG